MLNKRALVIVCLIFSIIYHFVFHFDLYGHHLSRKMYLGNSLLALTSVLIIILIYFGTYWRNDLKGSPILRIFDLLVVWIFISFFRSAFAIHGRAAWMDFLFNPFMGFSLFPVLFFLIGINYRYFSIIHKFFTFYCLSAWLFSLFFMNYPELQVFLLMPMIYIIVTFPLQSPRERLLALIISVTVIISSWTNRAGIMRLIISYMIVIIYSVIIYLKVNSKIINILLILILLSPFYLIYMGIRGENIMEIFLGSNTEGYSQENLRADTRTFLYFEVFQDLKMNRAFLLGKGTNAGYLSYSFQTLNRNVVEVGFLQMLIKSGILGFILYMTVIISAVFKALNRSNNLFMKHLGLLLSSYVLFFFIENVLAYNLLNIIIWIIAGMCHSKELREMKDHEIKELI